MSPWEPGQRLLGNLYIIILGTLTTFTWKTWEPCREPWRNLEGTFWGPFGNLLGTLREPCGTLGTFGTLREPWDLGNLYLGTFTWEPLLGNLYSGTFNWEPLLGNLGTFTWEPLTGNLYLGTWEPLLGNLYLGTFTWNLGTLGEWVLELLRSAPKPLLWLKTPKLLLLGKYVVDWIYWMIPKPHISTCSVFQGLRWFIPRSGWELTVPLAQWGRPRCPPLADCGGCSWPGGQASSWDLSSIKVGFFKISQVKLLNEWWSHFLKKLKVKLRLFFSSTIWLWLT